LENDLAGVLPFAGAHADAQALLSLVPDRVSNNARLKELLRSHGAVIDPATRTIDLARVDNLEFDGHQLIELFEMIVRGLYVHHWQLYLSPEFGVRARAFPRDAAAPALELFTQNAGARVEANLGDGAFLYQGIRTTDNPNASLWRFRILGGVPLFDLEHGRRILDEFLVSTLRREFWERVAAE
jgi:hypothetical protein